MNREIEKIRYNEMVRGDSNKLKAKSRDISVNTKYKRTMQEFSCSIITGIVKVTVIQPFDFIRFRIQSHHSLDHRLNIRKFIKSFISREGFMVFMKGLNVTTFSVFTSSIVQFTLYQRFFDFLSVKTMSSDKRRTQPYSADIFKVIDEELGKNKNSKKNNNLGKNLEEKSKIQKIVKKFSFTCALSGALSGISLALLLTPVDNIRIKLQAVQNLQISPGGKSRYRYTNSLDCIKDVYHNMGFKGFYVALPISLFRESVASLIYFGSFEYLKNREKVKYDRKRIKLVNSFLYGAFAGGVNWLLTLPVDVVKTKIISDTIIPDSQRFKSSMDCAKQIYSQSGMRGFYKGFSVVFTRAMIVNGVVLTSFDLCRSLFG